MNITNNNQKIFLVLIIFSLLVTISIAAIFKNNYISNKFTDSESFSCSEINQVVNIFSKNFKEVNFNANFLEEGEYEIMKVRTSENRPVEVYNPQAVVYSDEINEETLKSTSFIYENKIEKSIYALGFIKEFTYNRQTDNWDTHQYSFGDTKLVIDIPTNRESDFLNNLIKINCGKINKLEQEDLNRVSGLFSKDTALESVINKDSVLIVDVYEKNSLAGTAFTYDISKEKPEQIWGGSESIHCGILKERGIGKGLKCYDTVKKEFVEF